MKIIREIADPASRRLLSAILFSLIIVALIAATFALYAASSFVVPIMIAALVAIVLMPLADFMDRLGLHKAISSIVCVTAFLAFISALATMVLTPAYQLVKAIVSSRKLLDARLGPLTSWLDNLEAQWSRIESAIPLLGASGASVVLSERTIFQDVILAAPAIGIQFAFILLLTYFFIASRLGLKRKMVLERESLGESLKVARTIRVITTRISHYSLTITCINFVIGVIVGIGMYQAGFQKPVMWAGLAMLLNYIPYIGPIVMAGLMMLASIFSHSSIMDAAWPVILYLSLHALEANVLTPSLIGRRLVIHPAAILISMSFWGLIWGVAGILLAVPLLIIWLVMMEHLDMPNVLGYIFGEEILKFDANDRQVLK